MKLLIRLFIVIIPITVQAQSSRLITTRHRLNSFLLKGDKYLQKHVKQSEMRHTLFPLNCAYSFPISVFKMHSTITKQEKKTDIAIILYLCPTVYQL